MSVYEFGLTVARTGGSSSRIPARAPEVEPNLIESLAKQDLRTAVAEDVRLVESVQRGLESGGYRPAPLIVDPAGGVNSEHSILALYKWPRESMA